MNDSSRTPARRAQREILALVRPRDWADTFAAVLSEAYGLDVATALSLGIALSDVIEQADLRPRADAWLPVQVLDQMALNASYERMAIAEQVDQGIAHLAPDAAADHVRIGPQVWAGFFCASLTMTYALDPVTFAGLMDGFCEAVSAHGLEERPVKVISRPLLRDLPIDRTKLRAASRSAPTSR
jgi:hypothetical protein